MHKVAGQIQARVGIPLLHIAQATARALIEQGIRRAALLGTKYTMTQDFYQQALRQAGLEVLTPRGGDVELVNRVIYDELCLGVCREESRRACQDVIRGLAAEGAQAVILGCTEIGLLIRPEDSPLPVFDTARIHAAEAARLALEG